MRRLVDHVLSALPFEHDWFLAQGMRSTLVGHPFFDELDCGPRRGEHLDSARPLVLLLPGSRSQEIEGNFASMIRSAVAVHERVPGARFVVGALNERYARMIRGTLAAERQPVEVDVEVGRTRELISQADVALAVSGSVSLELLAARVPTVIVYRVSGLAYVVQSWYRRARFITLVNLLAAAEPIGPVQGVVRPPVGVPPADPDAVYPEYLAVADPADRAAGHLVEWLTEPAARRQILGRLDQLADEVAHGGSANRAAAAVLAIAAGDDVPAVAGRTVANRDAA
jgi:lipid-A-disaccharide synthase